MNHSPGIWVKLFTTEDTEAHRGKLSTKPFTTEGTEAHRGKLTTG